MANINDKPSRERPRGNADHPEGKQPGANATADPEAQRLADEVNAKGYIGIEADPTPNENYTLAGVLDGKPTPETDKGQAKAVREYQQNELTGLVEGVAGRADS